MLIVVNHTGQLCNRLFSIIPILAYSMEKKTHVFFFNSYKKYLLYFPALQKYKYFHFFNNIDSLFPNWIGRKLSNVFNSIMSTTGFPLSSMDNSYKIKIVDGWTQRHDDVLVLKYIEQIRSMFLPVIPLPNRIFMNYFFKRNELEKIVGVHIRRGDYISWHGGMYYYDDTVYSDCINRMRKLLTNVGFIPKFIVVSNENVLIKGVDIYTVPNSNEIADLTILSMCDFIMGPPSTFSEWASFIGNVPLYLIKDPKYKFCINDFSIIISMEKFNDGRIA